MAIRDRILDIEQRLKRLAGEPAPTEPIEIRQAVIQAVVDLAQPAGRGRRVLPYDRVAIDILAPSAETRRIFEAVFGRDEGLHAAIRRALAAAGCDAAAPLVVEVHYRKRAAGDWTSDQRFAVTGRASVTTPAPPPTAVPASGPYATPPGLPLVTLKVIKGRAVRKTVELRAERINIGRHDEVSDRDRRLVRRNQVVFVEGEPLSESVSRAHAHIRCTTTGDCRVRDDNSSYGTRIVRAGTTIDVMPSNTRGVRLQSGDELHLGRVILQVTLG